jgi:hypothetical protein
MTWRTNDVELNPLVIVTLPDALKTTPPPSFCEMKKLVGELSVLITSAFAQTDITAETLSPIRDSNMRRIVAYNFPFAYFLIMSLMQSAYHVE